MRHPAQSQKSESFSGRWRFRFKELESLKLA